MSGDLLTINHTNTLSFIGTTSAFYPHFEGCDENIHFVENIFLPFQIPCSRPTSSQWQCHLFDGVLKPPSLHVELLLTSCSEDKAPTGPARWLIGWANASPSVPFLRSGIRRQYTCQSHNSLGHIDHFISSWIELTVFHYLPATSDFDR